MTRTFIDAGVLIAAACGVPEISDIALRLLDEPKRVFISSDLVRLEVLPKPTYHGFRDEVAFYEAFFTNARRVAISKQLLEDALGEACQFGLGACDAIHVAAAKRAKCVEFHTTEKPSKPLFRVSGIKIVSLQAANESR